MRTLVPIVPAILGLAACASAQQPVILSFESNGSLTWSNAYFNAVETIERLTDVVTTGSAVTVTETLAVSDGSTDEYSYTVDHPPIVNPSVTISDGIYSFNDVTGSSTNPPVLWGVVVYPSGTVSATYFSHVPVPGTPIEVQYSYRPLSITQEWLRVYSEQATGEVAQAIVDMSEEVSLFRVHNAPPPMVLIPGGSNSGTNPLASASGESYDPCAYPSTYSLSVGAFYIDRHEVTNDEMVDVMQWAYDHGKILASSATVQNLQGNQQELLDLGAAGCRISWGGASFGIKAEKGSGYPCVEVSWYGAAAYCNYRSEMKGLTPCYNLNDWSCNLGAGGYRLPTDEEWEYAARGGLASKRFPWGDTISHAQANYRSYSQSGDYDLSRGAGYHPDYDDDPIPYTSPVGSFAPNGYGLYDMAGNVMEWCTDSHPCYAPSIVLRGGAWSHEVMVSRVGNRGHRYPFLAHYSTGFRAVRPTGQ